MFFDLTKGLKFAVPFSSKTGARMLCVLLFAVAIGPVLNLTTMLGSVANALVHDAGYVLKDGSPRSVTQRGHNLGLFGHGRPKRYGRTIGFEP